MDEREKEIERIAKDAARHLYPDGENFVKLASVVAREAMDWAARREREKCIGELGAAAKPPYLNVIRDAIAELRKGGTK